MMMHLTGVGPMFGQWTHFKLFAPKGGNDYSMARYTSEIKRLYDVLETRLGKVPYLGGGGDFILDIPPHPLARKPDAHGVEREGNTHLARWVKALRQSPPAKGALAQ